MKKTDSLSIGREAFLSLFSKVLTAGTGFAGVVIFANLLGDVGWGTYRTVLAAAFVLTQVPSGIGAAVKKRVSEVGVEPGSFFGTALLAHLAFSLVVAGAYVLLEPYAVDYFGTRELAVGVVLVVVSLGLFNIANKLYAGTGHPAVSSWVDGIRSLLTIALQLLFYWLGFEAFGLVLGLAIATVGTAVLAAVLSRVLPARPTKRVAERIYDFARWSVPTSMLSNFYSSADVLIIQAFVGPASVAYYSVSIQLAQPGAMFATTIGNVLNVKSSGVDSVGGDVRFDLINSISYAGLIAIPVFFGAAAMPKELVTTLFGSDFANTPVLVVVGMTLFQIGNAYRHPFEAVLQGTDRPELVFRVNSFIVLLHLPAAVALGSVYGLVGVVASTVAAEVVRHAVFQYVAHREFGGVVFTRPMLEQTVAGAVMFALVWSVLEYAVSITGWVSLLLVVGFGAVAYFTALLGLSSHFRETVRNTVPGLSGE
ncbi:polysaccharide biosynthesis protein [Haloferax prahovense DSM 18310]|uniref:Polysaccharide biosynthesis protein n=1 Tax=Haloferax prahovense (strain DSM 18310 / JCM 13924 / TL6) TaxID=1227461 RepID=M0GJW8_HALPT|nr:oligosaccharide flippase family protein [Haloferax prahovense]ELZ71149.1 polysaccharide biosynthesis protein [Haloferax prahovense DSM 18310]